MTSLTKQLQSAEAGSRELDAAIFVSLFGGEVQPEYYRNGLTGEEFKLMTGVSPVKTKDGWQHRKARPYTTSIDAALALVKEVLPGWDWSVSHEPEEGSGAIIEKGNKAYFLRHKSPAIALCLALLSAAAVEGSDG